MITFKVTGIEEARGLFSPKKIETAVTRTLNEIGKKARTATINAIAGKYNIKRGDLSETSTGQSRIKLFAASAGNNTAIINITGKPVSLAYFGAKQTVGNKVITAKKGYKTKRKGKLQGVAVEVLKGKKTLLSNSFIGAVKAGNAGFHLGVFVRVGKRRLPIIERKVVTLPTMFNNTNAAEMISKIVSGEFGTIFYRNLKWYDSK